MKIVTNNKAIKGIIKAIVIAMITVLPVISFAQPNPGGDPDEPIPLDGGISLLVAAGIGYGAKKLHDAKKKNRDNS